MARMSIDDMVTRDDRVKYLAKLCGWNRRETIGCLLDVWALCYDRVTHVLSERSIDMTAEFEGFAKHMIEAELAVIQPSGLLRIVGAKKRISYLESRAEAGRKGGIKSGLSRQKDTKHDTKQSLKQTEAPVNPSVPDPPSASVPDLVPSSVPDPEKNSARLARGSGSGKNGPTASELVVVRAVLDKLGNHSRTNYSGTDEHTRLITNQLRAGRTEKDLRGVIAHCAINLDWGNKPEMLQYLRPETLFGPKSISKYLDASRSWIASLEEDEDRDRRPGQNPIPSFLTSGIGGT